LNLDEVFIAILKGYYDFSPFEGGIFYIRNIEAILRSWILGKDFHL